MNIVLFYHSLISDWNHGNAHFLRGVASELIERGNKVTVYEPRKGWSMSNLLSDYGDDAIEEFQECYPSLRSISYDLGRINLDKALKDADLVIVHEWNEHALVKAVGEKKKRYGFKLLFHDTHHRAVTDRKSMDKYDLRYYDGVLAFGNIIRKIYLKYKWTTKAWTWHEAADTRVFKPMSNKKPAGDLVWIGNWGDEERTNELHQFLIEPAKELKIKSKVFGVRYPDYAKRALREAGIKYGGWLPNFRVPEIFARYRFTVHVPRGPYVKSLPGIPTIRPFEAMACGIPLFSAPWKDVEELFTPGKDFIYAENKRQMKSLFKRALTDDDWLEEISAHALKTIHERHTCAHRVDELYTICEEIAVKNIDKSTTV